jgi:hypothetical protein
MLKKLTLVAAITAVAALSVAAFAPATSADGGTRLVGRGVLDAQGDGLVAAKGKMDLTATADGGVLLVKDIAGDARVHVRGQGGSTTWHGFTVYFGFEGQARVTGSDVGVIVVGENIDLTAIGKGWAYLKGTGEYMVNNHGPFPWNPDGGFASVEPAP